MLVRNKCTGIHEIVQRNALHGPPSNLDVNFYLVMATQHRHVLQRMTSTPEGAEGMLDFDPRVRKSFIEHFLGGVVGDLAC